MPTVECVNGVVVVRVGKESGAVALHDLMTKCTITSYAEVEALEFKAQVHTECEVRMRITNFVAVLVVVDCTIVVEVVPDWVAWLSIIKNCLTSCASCVNLSLALPNAAIRHSVEITDWVTYFYERNVRRVLEQRATIFFCVVTNLSALSSQTCHFVLVLCEVHISKVVEVLVHALSPAEADFNTCVLDVTTIDVSRFLITQHFIHWSLNEPVLCSLLVPVESQGELATEEACIETEVELFTGFPSEGRIWSVLCVSTRRIVVTTYCIVVAAVELIAIVSIA